MSLLNSLESKFGRFAIPGLIRIIAGFQGLTFLILRLIEPAFAEVLVLDPGAVLHGEVWRLVTWVVVPRTLSILWILFVIMFLIFVGDGLEQAWGTFRLNAYVLAGIVFTDLGALLLYPLVPQLAGLPFYGEYFYASLLLAFAVLYPDVEIRLYGIIPIKAKWIGIVTAGFLVFDIVRLPLLALPVGVGLLNFLIFAVPLAVSAARQRSKVAVRRAKFEARLPDEDEAFHQCHACGRTDRSDPTLEFRVAPDGEEFCLPCLEKREDGETRAAG